jgi:CheY-like chemotaxis protein
MLSGEEAWNWLAWLKDEETTRQIPLMVLTRVEDQRKGLALGADAYCLKPIERQELLDQLVKLTSPKPEQSLLVIDDEETARYLLKKALAGTPYLIQEAADSLTGFEKAYFTQPDLIFLDLIMPGKNGFELLAQLQTDPATRRIPVVVVTSKVLTPEEQEYLNPQVRAILSKETLSREAVIKTVEEILSIEHLHIP